MNVLILVSWTEPMHDSAFAFLIVDSCAQGNLNGTEARIGWVSRMLYDEHSTTSEKYVDAFYFSFSILSTVRPPQHLKPCMTGIYLHVWWWCAHPFGFSYPPAAPGFLIRFGWNNCALMRCYHVNTHARLKMSPSICMAGGVWRHHRLDDDGAGRRGCVHGTGLRRLRYRHGSGARPGRTKMRARVFFFVWGIPPMHGF